MIALAKIKSDIKTYKRGEELGNEFSAAEIKRLIRLKAVEGSEYSPVSDAETGLFGAENPVFLTETELNKLPTKAKLVEYAESIGLDTLSTEQKKEELVDSILNYIEEMEEGEE